MATTKVKQRGVEGLETSAAVLARVKEVDGAGSGLDADQLDAQSSAFYSDIPARLGYTPLDAADYTAADVLAKLLTVDGVGSGLDADTLQGQEPGDIAGGIVLEADAQTSNFSLAVPWGHAIAGIYVRNNTSSGIVTGVKIGTTNGGVDICDALGIGALTEYYVTGSPPLKKRFFSRINNTTIFFTGITGAGVNLDVRVSLDKLF